MFSAFHSSGVSIIPVGAKSMEKFRGWHIFKYEYFRTPEGYTYMYIVRRENSLEADSELLRIFGTYPVTRSSINYHKRYFSPRQSESYQLGKRFYFRGIFLTRTVAYSRSRYPPLLIERRCLQFPLQNTILNVSCGETEWMRTIYRQGASYLYYPAVEESRDAL